MKRSKPGQRARVRAATRNGQDVVDLLVSTMRGEVDGATVPVRERLQAAAMILDRGWGKPTQRVQVGRTAKLSAAFGLDGLSDDAQDGPAH